MSKERYYPQLDTLRAIAALGVINLHWLNSAYPSLYGIEHSSKWGFGQYGVQLFFVLSGFLITDILLKNKEAKGKWNVIGNFYARRILRLFPIYYLLLLYLIVVKDVFVIDNIGWFASYTVNIKLYLEGDLVDVWSNHLWTLSVEEQFYLIFPILFLFIPKKKELWLPCLFLVLAIAFKQMSVFSSQSKYLLTIAQTDMLGIGILLGIVKNRKVNLFTSITTKSAKIVMIMTLSLCVIIYYMKSENSFIVGSFIYLMIIAFGLLVANTVDGFGGIVGKILNISFFQYLGKISYGLYLYHKVIPLSLLIILNKLDITIENIILYYVVNLSILFVVSHFSWKFIEAPIIKLKSNFEYK